MSCSGLQCHPLPPPISHALRDGCNFHPPLLLAELFLLSQGLVGLGAPCKVRPRLAWLLKAARERERMRPVWYLPASFFFLRAASLGGHVSKALQPVGDGENPFWGRGMGGVELHWEGLRWLREDCKAYTVLPFFLPPPGTPTMWAPHGWHIRRAPNNSGCTAACRLWRHAVPFGATCVARFPEFTCVFFSWDSGTAATNSRDVSKQAGHIQMMSRRQITKKER